MTQMTRHPDPQPAGGPAGAAPSAHRRLPPTGAEGAPANELLDMILAVMPDAAVVVDDDGTMVAVNSQAGAIFGYGADDLVGRPVEVLVPERFRTRHRGNRRGYMVGPVMRSMGTGLQLSGRRHDGSEFPIDVSLAPVGDGDRALVVAAIRDVSERLEAAATQMRLAALVQSNHDGIVTLSPRCTITSWNPGATRLFGFEAAAMMGRHVSALVPQSESESFEELLAAAAEGRPAQAADTRWNRADGTLLDVAVSLSALDPVGDDPGGYSLIVRDVTERKRAERLLAHREQWIQALADIRLSIVSQASLTALLERVADHMHQLLPGATTVAAVEDSGTWPEPLGAGGLTLPVPAGALEVLVGDERHRVGALPDLLQELGEVGPVLGRALAPRGDRAGDPPGGHGDRSGGLGDPPGDLGDPPGGLDDPPGMLDDPPGMLDDPPGMLDDPAGVLGHPTGEVVCARVTGVDAVLGALVVTVPGSVSDDDATGIAGLAEQVSLGLRLAQSRQREQHLLLADDRARIARDLHDHVIQALFAAGMRLQSAVPLVADERAAGWIGDVVGELDDTIGRIRTTIFSLQAPRDRPAGGLRAAVLDLCRAGAGQLGFEPDVRFSGPVETVPDAIRPHLLAVAREALSNAARHAAARHVTVEVTVGDGSVALVVTDDGRGVGDVTRTSGLANARDRAEQLGGSLTLSTPGGGGTALAWEVPLA